MVPRNERRSAIEASFETLRSRVATALGAAENERHRVRAEFEQQEFALRIAERGVSVIEQNPERIEGSDSPAFAEALRLAQRERDEVYAEWTTRGPDQLAGLVDEVAPGTAGDRKSVV